MRNGDELKKEIAKLRAKLGRSPKPNAHNAFHLGALQALCWMRKLGRQKPVAPSMLTFTFFEPCPAICDKKFQCELHFGHEKQPEGPKSHRCSFEGYVLLW